MTKDVDFGHPRRGFRGAITKVVHGMLGPDGAYAGGLKATQDGDYWLAEVLFYIASKKYSKRLSPTDEKTLASQVRHAGCLLKLDHPAMAASELDHVVAYMGDRSEIRGITIELVREYLKSAEELVASSFNA